MLEIQNLWNFIKNILMPTTKKKQEVSFCLKLRNGDIVTGKSELKLINFDTKYGKLELPVEDLSKINFGIIPNKKVQQKVDAFVDILQSGNEKTCKQTFQSLIDAEILAIPILENYIEEDNSIFEEYSVSFALDFLKDKYEVKEFLENDIIKLLDDYAFPGISDINQITLNTEFGDLTIPRESIENIDIIQSMDNSSGLKIFKLEANKHLSANAQGGWLKTNIKLKSGQKFFISSKGEIIMASLSNQPHKPSGSFLPPNGSWTAGNDTTPGGSAIFGNVVYKNGDQGVMLKAGTQVEMVANQSGMLYLSIYETVFNGANSGHYTVKVKL